LLVRTFILKIVKKCFLKAKSLSNYHFPPISEVRPLLLAGGAESRQRHEDLTPDHRGLQHRGRRAGQRRGRAQGGQTGRLHSLPGQCHLVKVGDRVFMILSSIDIMYSRFGLFRIEIDTSSLFVLFIPRKLSPPQGGRYALSVNGNVPPQNVSDPRCSTTFHCSPLRAGMSMCT